MSQPAGAEAICSLCAHRNVCTNMAAYCKSRRLGYCVRGWEMQKRMMWITFAYAFPPLSSWKNTDTGEMVVYAKQIPETTWALAIRWTNAVTQVFYLRYINGHQNPRKVTTWGQKCLIVTFLLFVSLTSLKWSDKTLIYSFGAGISASGCLLYLSDRYAAHTGVQNAGSCAGAHLTGEREPPPPSNTVGLHRLPENKTAGLRWVLQPQLGVMCVSSKYCSTGAAR